jgi:CDP-diacylglycerol--glycerol-3-phosphate 3-phosphatidyltransferase
MPVITVATWLTITRIVLTPLFAASLYRQHTGEALLIFFFACLTDTFDGLLARRFRQKTDFGALLDALADKLLLTVAYLMMSLFPGDTPNVVPLWLTATVIARDLFILGGGGWLRRRYPQASLPPTIWGKWSTTLQMAVIVLALIGNAWNRAIPLFALVLWTALLLTLFSGIHYGKRAITILHQKDVDGVPSSPPPIH